MPTRTINFTGRKRIRREDAHIALREHHHTIEFDVTLRLAKYNFPQDARVFVEAYRQTQYMRFDFGQVGAMQVPKDRVLGRFDSPDGLLFRVKVVTSSEPHGLLLAQADRIRPRKSDEEDMNRICLLPVKSDDSLEKEVWRVDFDEQTILLVNSALGDKDALVRDPAFYALVYPAVVRIILSRILHVEEYTDTEDLDDWRSCWLRFACALPGISDPPSVSEQVQVDDWIDSAVLAFCKRHKTLEVIESDLTGDLQQ